MGKKGAVPQPDFLTLMCLLFHSITSFLKPIDVAHFSEGYIYAPVCKLFPIYSSCLGMPECLSCCSFPSLRRLEICCFPLTSPMPQHKVCNPTKDTLHLSLSKPRFHFNFSIAFCYEDFYNSSNLFWVRYLLLIQKLIDCSLFFSNE